MALLHLRNQSQSFRRSLVPGLIGDVTLDHLSERIRPPGKRVHLLSKFGQRFVQPFQARVSPCAKKPGAFRRSPAQLFQSFDCIFQSFNVIPTH